MAKRKTIGARELKTRLGQYIHAVRQGETFVVTERGEPVAELRPLVRPQTDLEAALDGLAAAGIMTRGTGRPLAAFKAVRISGRPVSDTIRDDRKERF